MTLIKVTHFSTKKFITPSQDGVVRTSRDLHWEMRTREQDPSAIFLPTLRELRQSADDCGSCWNRTSDKDRGVTLSQSCHPLCIPNPHPDQVRTFLSPCTPEGPNSQGHDSSQRALGRWPRP